MDEEDGGDEGGGGDLSGRIARLRLGVVVREQPGVTRWVRRIWRPVAVIPGAEDAHWRELRRDGDVVDYLAGTVEMEVYRTDTEAYRVALSNQPPSVYVILRPDEDPDSPHEVAVFRVTASAFEAQDYLDSGEEIVEPVPMPPELIAWLSAFVGLHHRDETFVKRARRNWSAKPGEDGLGDERIAQDTDVYRTPGARRRGQLH